GPVRVRAVVRVAGRQPVARERERLRAKETVAVRGERDAVVEAPLSRAALVAPEEVDRVRHRERSRGGQEIAVQRERAEARVDGRLDELDRAPVPRSADVASAQLDERAGRRRALPGYREEVS